jgi:RIO-like serine/threonine protein kinase
MYDLTNTKRTKLHRITVIYEGGEIMSDFELIKVERVTSKGKKTLSIYNPTPYKLIGHGVRGAVFQLDESRCVKVSANPKDSSREAEALKMAENIPFIPKVFEAGSNFIIMEFFKGITLSSFIKKKKMLPEDYSRQIVECIRAMKEIGFTKIKLKLSQIIVTDNEELKFVDHSGVFTDDQPYPLQLFNQLKNVKLLDVFLEHVSKLDPDMHSEWKQNVDFSKKIIELIKKEGYEKKRF